MSLHQRFHYYLWCDNCGCSFGYWEGSTTTPQAIWTQAVHKYGWTSFDNDVHHCAKCPPICPQCGIDDCEHLVEEHVDGAR